MTKLYIIRNQSGLYLSKQQEWLEGGDRGLLFRTVHHDEAINTVFEISSRDIHLRAETVLCDADARGNPVLTTASDIDAESRPQEASSEEVADHPAVDAEGAAEAADNDENAA